MTTYAVSVTCTCPAFLGSPPATAIEVYVGEHGADPSTQVSPTNVLDATTGGVNANLQRLVSSTEPLEPSKVVSLRAATMLATKPAYIVAVVAKQDLTATQSKWFVWDTTVHTMPAVAVATPALLPAPLADGVVCVAGATCTTCANPASTWRDGGFKCGADGTAAAPPKAGEGEACGACLTGLLCCGGTCVKEVRASAGAIGQCPADCRGDPSWPPGTCGRTWNTNITSRCDTCKWSDRTSGACADCLAESAVQTTGPTGTKCETFQTNYTCPGVFTREGAQCTRRWTESVRGPCIRWTTPEMTTCAEYQTETRPRTLSTAALARTTCTSSVATCPLQFDLVNENSCVHPTARTCPAGYSLAPTPNADNTCVKVGECATGWTKHASSSAHCIK